MNRITAYLPKSKTQTLAPRMPRAGRRSRQEVEAMLREIAFVLKMTQRVKAQIVEGTTEENEPSESFSA